MLYGAHLSSAGGISTAIDRAGELGCDAVQIFTQSPRMWRPTEHSDEQIARFRGRRKEAGVKGVVCHALYLVNLAGADRELHRKSVTAMRASMETASAIGAEGVVFHVGSHLGKGLDAGYKRAVPALRELLELTDERLWLVLENSAGAGGTIGRSVDELAALFERLDRHERLGICLDSCHWWVSGVDVTDPEALEEALVHVDDSIGLDRLRCLHVNDAAAPLGSNRDRHENIGDGLIGDKLTVFLGHPKLQGLPALLEVPGDGHGPDLKQMTKLRALYAKATKRSARRRGSSAPAARGTRG